MAKQPVPYTTHYPLVMEALTGQGLLLGSTDAAGKDNIMTIGWGSLGSIWGMPIWTVLVRPSRYTYQAIEHSQGFTVNVPGGDLNLACAVCGSKSGRDTDKFTETHLTAERAGSVIAPVVAECPMVYECQVIHSNDILPAKLANEILNGSYVDGDYHRVYFGKVLHTYAEPDAAEKLEG